MLEPLDKPRIAAEALELFRKNATTTKKNSNRGYITCSPTRLLREANVAPLREEFIYSFLKHIEFLIPVKSGRGMREITLIVNMKQSLDPFFATHKPKNNQEQLRKLKLKRTQLEDDVDAAHELVQNLTDKLKLINEQIDGLS